jgi:hypothetical protein
MTIVNHKTTNAEVIVKLGNYYGDNLKITWDNAKNKGVTLEKVSTS